jgi:hypothetical protein
VFGAGAVGPHPVAVAVDVEDDAAMEEPIEHRRSDGGVIENATPGRDAEVGRERDRALAIALGDDLEESGGGLCRQRQVAIGDANRGWAPVSGCL